MSEAEMVRAILDGRKTQTRRVMKVQPYPDSIVTVEHYHPTVIDRHGDMQPGKEIFGAHWDDGEYGLRCPYGAPGDLLWVRETWAPLKSGNVDFAADWSDTQRKFAGKWRPSIHMPRWASRITLRITDVRVERVQDISEEDAGAEGMPDYSTLSEASGENLAEAQTRLRWRQRQFASLWDQINGPGAWEANPWVWAVSFERVKP